MFFCFSNPSCVPLTRKLLIRRIGGKQFYCYQVTGYTYQMLLIFVAKEPPEKFSRKKLAEICHDITGMLQYI